MLATEEEKQNLKQLFDRLARRSISGFYETLFTALGAMRAGFKVYRAFEEDG